MTLRVVPEGLAAASAAVEALTARLAAAHASAAPVITAVVPPAADPVSLQTAAGFSAQGVEHAVVRIIAIVMVTLRRKPVRTSFSRKPKRT